jgi:uncharacterized protein YndB with AHSA1/START domain
MTERTLSTIRPEAGHATVHVEDVYDTTVDDLWSAVTVPERLARWIAEVDGDLRVGGTFRIRFTSGWEGTGEVVSCEPPHRLRVSNRETDGSSTVLEAVVTAEGDRARLVVEEHGLPLDGAEPYAAGWQVHLEDLGAVLAGRERSDWSARWRQLIPSYRPQG